jgi:hypothetical protein
MSRWYKAAIACAVAFAVSWFAIPEYYYQDKGGYYGVYRREIGLGWNWRDAEGNPVHDAAGNAIKPNRVRTAVLAVLAVGAVGLAGAGLAFPKRRRPRDDDALAGGGRPSYPQEEMPRPPRKGGP